jgi:hypothetical protein
MDHEVSSFGNKLAEKRPENINYLVELYEFIVSRSYVDNSEAIRFVERIDFTDQMAELIFHNDSIQYGPAKKGMLLVTIYLSDCDAEMNDKSRYELRVDKGIIELYKRVVSETDISRERCTDLEVNNLVRDIEKLNLTHRDEQL